MLIKFERLPEKSLWFWKARVLLHGATPSLLGWKQYSDLQCLHKFFFFLSFKAK